MSQLLRVVNWTVPAATGTGRVWVEIRPDGVLALRGRGGQQAYTIPASVLLDLLRQRSQVRANLSPAPTAPRWAGVTYSDNATGQVRIRGSRVPYVIVEPEQFSGGRKQLHVRLDIPGQPFVIATPVVPPATCDDVRRQLTEWMDDPARFDEGVEQ